MGGTCGPKWHFIAILLCVLFWTERSARLEFAAFFTAAAAFLFVCGIYWWLRKIKRTQTVTEMRVSRCIFHEKVWQSRHVFLYSVEKVQLGAYSHWASAIVSVSAMLQTDEVNTFYGVMQKRWQELSNNSEAIAIADTFDCNYNCKATVKDANLAFVTCFLVMIFPAYCHRMPTNSTWAATHINGYHVVLSTTGIATTSATTNCIFIISTATGTTTVYSTNIITSILLPPTGRTTAFIQWSNENSK